MFIHVRGPAIVTSNKTASYL